MKHQDILYEEIEKHGDVIEGALVAMKRVRNQTLDDAAGLCAEPGPPGRGKHWSVIRRGLLSLKS